MNEYEKKALFEALILILKSIDRNTSAMDLETYKATQEAHHKYIQSTIKMLEEVTPKGTRQ